jgi:DNA-binding beta-propeller fold protein YncE
VLVLLAVLLCACGFIGGVLVEKGEGSSGSSGAGGAAAGLASRFAALRGGSSAGSSARGGGGVASLLGGGAGRPTAGTVAYLDGSTLYVTNAEGNTVKVTTSPATTVRKTVSADVKGIHPGEAVTIVGATGTNGSVSAESISIGAGGTGLAALFGARGGGAAKEPSLFGGGG